MSATVFFNSASEIATVRNVFELNGVPTDPTTIALIITTPTQVPTTYTFALAEIVKNSTGDYQKDITCNLPGEWTYRWEGAGADVDTAVGTWTVFDVELGKLYATVEALKSRLGIPLTDDTIDDYELHAACFAASRDIEQYAERHFWRTAAATVRTFVPDHCYRLRLPEFNDLVSVATLKTDSAGDGTFETTWTAGVDYQLLPYNPSAAPEQKPYTQVRAIGAQTFPLLYGYGRADRVEITGVFGWPAVPYGIRQAALIHAAATFRLKDAPLGFSGNPELGVVRVRANPMVEKFADPYRRNAMLVA